MDHMLAYVRVAMVRPVRNVFVNVIYAVQLFVSRIVPHVCEDCVGECQSGCGCYSDMCCTDCLKPVGPPEWNCCPDCVDKWVEDRWHKY